MKEVSTTIGILESRSYSKKYIGVAIKSGALPELTVNRSKIELVKRDVKKFVTKVIGNLQAHFPEIEKPIIKAFDIFQQSQLPLDNSEFATYGYNELLLLCRKY